MTIAEMITKLEQFARQSDDGARAEEIVATAFRPEWMELTQHTARVEASVDAAELTLVNQARARANELRGYVLDKERNAMRLRGEAEIFREIADELRDYADEIGTELPIALRRAGEERAP